MRSSRVGMGKGRGTGYKNMIKSDPVVHSRAGKGMKTYSSMTEKKMDFDGDVNVQKLRKPDNIFQGRYYTSGKGKQYVRTWREKDGTIELTTVSMPDGEKWYELRVRNRYWDSGRWWGRDYESKKTAEEGVKKSMNLLKNMKTQNLSFGELVKDEGVKSQKNDFELLDSNLPRIDWKVRQ